MLKNLPQFNGIQCTINTTEDCNLRCKYCYETCKKPNSIELDTCKKFIDLILEKLQTGFGFSRLNDIADKGVNLDFIGGDSLIDPKLLDEILKYFNYRINELNLPQKNHWKASLSTNGTLFEKKDVRDFCEKWKDNLSIGVSIDGCPEIHDKNRVFPNGEGSMASILKWWGWYKSVFVQDSMGTKATCAKDSIPYLFKSLKYMHEDLGLNYINQNFIMEDMELTQEDLDELDKQLELCTHYCLEHCNEIYWSMIDGRFLKRKNDGEKEDFDTKGWCGSGCMPTLGIDGDIYPCFRWLPHTQNGKKVMVAGNINDGFNIDIFNFVSDNSIRCKCTRDPKCVDCEYEPCCSYCIGGCYAENNDFIRTTHICEVIKLQCKWAKYYWSEYERNKG